MVFLTGQTLRVSLRSAAVLVLLSGFPTATLGLRTTPGSPCESICSPTNNTTGSEIVCLDDEYSTTDTGKKFQQCVACELDSTFADGSGQTDVEWGLYNLRYAFTSCVYGFPQKVADISNPCPVACEDLATSLQYDMKDPSGLNFDTYCGTSSFADSTVTECEACYNLTLSDDSPGSPSQVYISNFLEALRYNCHFRTPTHVEFPIDPTRIFAESMLPSSTADLISPSAQPGSGVNNLALVIALPILGFVILVCVLAIGCFFFIRSRRKKVRRLRQTGHLHARWNDTTISTPQWATEYPVQAQGMYSPSPVSPVMYHPGYVTGMGFIDTDGRPQDIGYSYPSMGYPSMGYPSMGEPVIASPSVAYSPEEKLPPHPSYFSSPASDSKQSPP